MEISVNRFVYQLWFFKSR